MEGLGAESGQRELSVRRPQSIERLPPSCEAAESRLILGLCSVMLAFALGLWSLGLFAVAIEATLVNVILLACMSVPGRGAQWTGDSLPRATARVRESERR